MNLAVGLPKVDVVLSTYAARHDWLEQQLASVWAQQGVDVTVTVRDDGSPDDTADRVALLLAGRPAQLVRGPNVGPAHSFLLGLREANEGDYVAFCDQDDVWLPHKLRRAVDALSQGPSCVLYSANVELVDDRLNSLGNHPVHRRGHSFANALVQNAATGCTIVLDRPAANLLQRALPRKPVMHDAWAYLVVSGCGRAVYDPEPVVRYRQHGANVVGAASTGWARWRGRVLRQAKAGTERVHTVQDRELAELYGEDLSAGALALLTRHLRAADGGPLRRLAWALSGPAHRQDIPSDFVYRLLFALGRV